MTLEIPQEIANTESIALASSVCLKQTNLTIKAINKRIKRISENITPKFPSPWLEKYIIIWIIL